MSEGRSKISYLLERLSQGVAAHNRENPGHHTWGIGMSYFDIERLGLEEGEEILPGIMLQSDGGVSGNFRVLCDGDHGAGEKEEEEVLVDAVSEQEEQRELEIVRPGYGGGDEPPPLRPPF